MKSGRQRYMHRSPTRTPHIFTCHKELARVRHLTCKWKSRLSLTLLSYIIVILVDGSIVVRYSSASSVRRRSAVIYKQNHHHRTSYSTIRYFTSYFFPPHSPGGAYMNTKLVLVRFNNFNYHSHIRHFA